MGFWRNKRVSKGLSGFVASAFGKNVAKTLEKVSFAKKMLLWLLNGGRSTNAAAATAVFVFFSNSACTMGFWRIKGSWSPAPRFCNHSCFFSSV